MDENGTPQVRDPKPLSSYWESLQNISDKARSMSKGNISLGGEPIFEKIDVFTVNQSIAQLLRYILVMHNITWHELMDKTTVYAHHLNVTQRDLGILKGNLKKDIKKTKITFNKLEQIISSILGFSIEDLTLTIKDKSTGQVYRHSLSDVENLIKDDPTFVMPPLDDSDDTMMERALKRSRSYHENPHNIV